MAKQTINVGRTPNDKSGDSLRVAFQKVNANFSELYTQLGLVNDPTLNLGAFEFNGSVMSTTDSSGITIDQSTTITSDLTVGGDILPTINNGGNLGSPSRQWKSLYVSTSTIYINNIPLSIDQSGNLTIDGDVVAGGNSFDQSLNTTDNVTFNSVGATTINVSQINGTNPGDELIIQANNHNWTFGTDGKLTLPVGGDILNSNGDSVLGGGGGINYAWNVNTTQYTITEQYRDTETEEYWVKVSGNGIQNEAEGLVEAGLEYRFRLSQDDPGVFRVLSGGIVFTGGSSTINLADLADINYVGSTISTVIRYNTVTELVNGEGVNLSLVNNNKLVISSTSGVDGLTGNTTFEPLTEGQVNYELDIEGQDTDSNITLTLYRGNGTGPGELGPGISLGKSISDRHRAGVVAIGNDDVGYNSKQGGVYIGAKAGWNNVEGPQGEYAIAIGTRAAYTFAHDGTITLNATGENLDPQQADSLYIKPIREVAENTSKVLYYNTTTGEVTYADGGSYTPDDAGLWNDPTVNTVQAALDELAAKVAALQNFEIDGGNANTPAAGELLIDGNGA